ncbi:MAG: MBG domain-containing protein [Gemmatimonadota bacterium]
MILKVRTVVSAVVAATALVVLASGRAHAQTDAQKKVLVYCPSNAAAQCTSISNALSGTYAVVQRAYDGGSATLNLATADLSGFSLLVVPSGSTAFYGLLRSNVSVKSQLTALLVGRVVIYSGTPDLGSGDATKKATLLRNLATWVTAGSKPGVVVLQDAAGPGSSGTEYDWLTGISGVSASANLLSRTYSQIDPTTVPAGSVEASLLNDGSGGLLAYTGMASDGVAGNDRAKGQFLQGGTLRQGNSVLYFVDRPTEVAQSITFGALATKTYGDAPFALSATGGGSGNPVTFALGAGSAGCSLSSGTVTITGATAAGQSCIIVASQASSVGYNAATPVTQSLTVNKASLSVNANAATTAFGTAPTLSASLAGFVNGENASSAGVTGAAACSLVDTPTTAGTHTGAITCAPGTLAAANYTFATGSAADLTIDQGTQTINFAALAGRTFGAAPFAVSANATSGLTVSFGVTGNCSLDGTTVTLTGAGSCTVTASQAGNTNYGAATPVSHSFDIAKAKATISVQGYTGVYDGNPHGATGTATGIGNVDLSAGLSLGASYTNVPGGTASWSFTGGANYEDASGTVAIVLSKADQAAVSVSAPASMTFGQAAVTLTASGGSGTGAYTFSVGSPTGCSVTGDQLTVTNASSTCTVTASRNGDGNYNVSAASPAATVALVKAAGSVSINNIPSTAVYLGNFTPAFTKSGDGAGSVTSLTPLTCTVNGAGLVSYAAAGACQLQASVAEGTNHLAATGAVQGFTIAKANQAALLVVAPSPGVYATTYTITSSGGSIPGALVTYSVGASTACTMSVDQLLMTSGVGTCAVTASNAGNANYNAVTSAAATVTPAKRMAVVEYTGDHFAVTAGPTITTASIRLSATVTRADAGSLGDLTKAQVTFVVKRFNGAALSTVQANVDASGNAIATLNVPASDDPYTVETDITAANQYWDSNTGHEALTVKLGNSEKSMTGGGWIADADSRNGKDNFGFNAGYLKNGSPKGNAVFVFRSKDGFDYVVKTNSWSGGGLSFLVDNNVTKASFTARATVQKINITTGLADPTWNSGGFTMIVDLLDGDLNTPRTTDSYAITILNGSGGVWKRVGTRTAQVTLGGGNVAVQSK